ncbi:TRAP transporter small permease [Pelagibacterium limicola]|uniref:TRAP transporter small permease n=1 Tax=Pelagibacterium limicola TaxID=2791022 RepID=UPI0018AFCF8B|nr:TRAP transporter small permease [Pelagibacterium limicola]
MQRFDTILTRICQGAGILGVASILALMALTVTTVVFRALSIAFPGTYSLSELLLIPAVSLSLAYAAMQNEHTRVVLFVDRIANVRLRHAINALMLIVGSLFWVFVAWATIREAIRRGAQGELSPIINVPVAPFRWTMAAAIVLLVIVLVWQGIKLLSGKELQDQSKRLDTKL